MKWNCLVFIWKTGVQRNVKRGRIAWKAVCVQIIIIYKAHHYILTLTYHLLLQISLIFSFHISEQTSCLRVEFVLKRFTVYYILETYIPCFFIVMLSWLSFWIHAEYAPARVTLGVTTVLTMITQSWVSRANLPMVSYVKAMDVWIGMCLVFVFCAMLEYALVCVLHRREQKELRIQHIIERFKGRKLDVSNLFKHFLQI